MISFVFMFLVYTMGVRNPPSSFGGQKPSTEKEDKELYQELAKLGFVLLFGADSQLVGP